MSRISRFLRPITLVLLCMGPLSCGGLLRGNGAYHPAQQSQSMDEDELSAGDSLPMGVRVMRDVAYGPDPHQRMDIYLPPHAENAPVILMVHGGAWRLGDKGSASVVENKVARWVTKGFIFISTNYRMLPDTPLLDQEHDIARALATAQERAESWGGDSHKFIVMGHSAGAHLAALLAASPDSANKSGVKPWLGTVLLDSAALDVEKIMEASHLRLYDRAFGNDPAHWHEVSPIRVLTEVATPMLAVCSTQRSSSCSQAQQFAARANMLKVRVTVLEEDLPHREINRQLGVAGHYTDAVETFMASLNSTVEKMLTTPPAALR